MYWGLMPWVTMAICLVCPRSQVSHMAYVSDFVLLFHFKLKHCLHFYILDIRNFLLILFTFLLSLLARHIFSKDAPNASLGMIESITDGISWQSISRLGYGNQINTTLMNTTSTMKPYLSLAETKFTLNNPNKILITGSLNKQPLIKSRAISTTLLDNSGMVTCANNQEEDYCKGREENS